APSLRAADVGISVEKATDVARAAADILLLEPDLGVLHAGVMEGRVTFGNVMKYILMATSSNFGNMFSMAAATLFLPFLPMLPMQILLNNLLYDLSEIPIPTDRVDREELLTPPRWDMHLIRTFMLVMGLVSSVFDFATFWILTHVFCASAPLFRTGWFVESLVTQVLVIFIIRTRRSPAQSLPSLLLTVTTVGIAITAAMLPWSPLCADLGFIRPSAALYLALAAVAAAYLTTVEGVKRLLYRHLAATRTR
ncbi:MAG: magnesium-translocating P-type ATPase, partial [Proteobacteria bacterium]|nr:magnesium-translocating P-type ATPase [Pseudomonadota bacterium]